MKYTWLVALSVSLSLAGVAGCSDDTPESNNGGGIVDPNNQSNNDNNGTNNGDPDTGPADATDAENLDAADAGDTDETDADTGGGADTGADAPATCPDVPCDSGNVCVDNACVEETAELKCSLAEDLGTLSPGSPITIDDTTDGASDVLSAGCAQGEDNDELVYKFEVSEDSLVSFESDWPDQFDAKVEFRTGSCDEPDGADVSCFDSNSSVSLQAGEPAWLVIEQDVGRGNGFALDLSASTENCPAGVETCSAGTLEVCLGGTNSNTYSCAGDCDDDRCAGTLCDNAIPVSASATFAGDLEAYETNLNFNQNQFCYYQGTPLDTPGPEVVFKLEGLSDGQVVTFNTGGNRAMFIVPDCSVDPMPCAHVLTSAGTTSSVDWTVPSTADDQDFYVIIDKRTGATDEFSYGIEINTP